MRDRSGDGDARAAAQVAPGSLDRRAVMPRLAVIAPDRFLPALAAFVAHKQRDLPTELVALERVLAGSEGVDAAEQLKRWLWHGFHDRDVRYALLVGDASVLPVRYMVLDRVTEPAFHTAFYPSDLYYADLVDADGAFETWNARRDGHHAHYFGEVRGERHKDGPINQDDVDYRVDCAVGRWPVSTPEEVAAVAAKTIAYETDGAGEGRRHRAVFVSVDGWVDTRARMERLAALLPDGFESLQLRSGTMPPPDEAQVRAQFDRGLDLLVHAGHGHDEGWEHSLSSASLPKLAATPLLPVVFSAGCSTARFATLPPYEPYLDVLGAEHPGTNAGEVFSAPPPPPACYQPGAFDRTGLGERLVRLPERGAVAYIGCNTGSQPCGLTLMDGFVAAFARADTLRLGDAWAQAIGHYWETERLATLEPDDGWYPPSVFFQGMKFMLFGDPSLRLRGRDR